MSVSTPGFRGGGLGDGGTRLARPPGKRGRGPVGRYEQSGDFSLAAAVRRGVIASEVPVDAQWKFLAALKATGENGNVGIPAQRSTDDEVRKCMRQALCSNKGSGWAARLFEDCDIEDLPLTAVEFLKRVYAQFPKEEKPATAEGDAYAVADI